MTLVLEIYLAPSGQWSGRVIQDGEEVGGCAGCSSPAEVEEAVRECGWEPDQIVRRQDPASES
jgi:hypothetical protein